MPKILLRLMLIAICLCSGVLLFAACDQQSPETKGISIETLPDTILYTVGQELSLTGGQLKVLYEDDSTKLFPMSLATPSISQFNNAVSEQQVVLTFLGFTTRFSVVVNKGTLQPVLNSSGTQNNIPVVYSAYTGGQQDFSGLDMLSLPDENLTVEYKYKNTSHDGDFVSTPPTNAGEYLVEINIAESQNYNGIKLTSYFVIQKTSLFDLTTNNENLNYDNIALNTQYGKYGAGANLSGFWRYANGSLGDAPLPASVSAELQYAYKKVGESEYTTIPRRTTDGSHVANLDVGEYDIRISLYGDSNIEDYVYVFRYIITQANLTRGQDFDLYLTDGTNTTLLDATQALPVVAYTAGKTYSLTLVSYVGEGITLNSGTIYYAGNSTSGDTTLAPSGAGEYRVVYSVSGNTNYAGITTEVVRFTFE